MTISGLTITDGNASSGGGIDNSGTLTLDRVAVTGNQANGADSPFSEFDTYGGGIQNELCATLTVKDSTVSDNQVVGDGGQLIGGTVYGGGIANNGVLTIVGSTIDGNQALGGASTLFGGDAFGGGIYDVTEFTATPPDLPADLTIIDSTIAGNQSIGASVAGTEGIGGYGEAGGIFNGGGVTATIDGSTISGNQAIGGTAGESGFATGGGMLSEGSILTITGTAFTNNSAQGGDGVDGAFIPTGNTATAGGLDSEYDLLTITGSTFRGNEAIGGEAGTSSGAGASVGGGAIGGGLVDSAGEDVINGIPLNATASITGSEFVDNQAIGGAGQGFEGGSSDGGAIVVWRRLGDVRPGDDPQPDHHHGNFAIGGADLANGAGGFAVGAGISDSTSLTVSHSTIGGNQAIGGAGGAGGTHNNGASASGAGL